MINQNSKYNDTTNTYLDHDVCITKAAKEKDFSKADYYRILEEYDSMEQESIFKEDNLANQ